MEDYKLKIGSRAQVMHGTAKMTGGGLMKFDLKYKSKKDNNDSIQRRIESDGRDFASFKDYDLLLTDENFDCNFVYDLMN